MAKDNLPGTAGRSAVAGMVVAVLGLIIATMDGGPVGGEALAGWLIGAAVFGCVIGGVVGGVMDEVANWIGAGQDGQRHATDLWDRPADRCAESATAVVKLLDTLPDSPAADWLTEIAEAMAVKLAEINVLVLAGRAAVPITGKRAVAEAKSHPLYAQLVRSADEFAEIADQVGKLMIQLHLPLELDPIRVQLQVFTEQLPTLRQDS